MTERIVKPLRFFEAVKEIIVFYGHVFKHIVGLVVLASLIQALISIFMPEDPTIGLALSVLASIVAMFFYAWILYHADNVFMNRGETVKESLHVAKKRFIPLMGVLFFYVLLILAFIAFGFGMQLLGNALNATVLFAIITTAIFIFIITLLAFTMPAVVLDQMPIFKSFDYSVRLVWGHWWHTFGIIFLFGIPVILLSLAVLLLPTRNILILTAYEFVYHIFTYPLMTAVILILYHDLKARHQVEGFKQISEKPPAP